MKKLLSTILRRLLLRNRQLFVVLRAGVEGNYSWTDDLGIAFGCFRRIAAITTEKSVLTRIIPEAAPWV